MATAAKKSQYGTKYLCFKCACKFYDLNKPTPLCPKCGSDQRQAPKVAEPPKATRASKRVPEPVPEIVEDAPIEDADGLDFDDEEVTTGGAANRKSGEEEEEEEEDEG